MTDETPDPTSEAARCPKCGYSLLGLREFRCPECGEPFDPEYVASAPFRAHLLPWERPELGGPVRRLILTTFWAWLRPWSYFASAGRRKDQVIANGGAFIAASVILSFGLCMLGFFLGRVTLFLLLLGKHGQPWRCLKAVALTTARTWSLGLDDVLVGVLPGLASVFLLALLLRLVFPRRSAALRAVDFAAFHSPAVVLGALIQVLGQVLSSTGTYYGVLGALMPPVVATLLLLCLAWFCCRRVLLLHRVKTVGAVVTFAIVQFYVATAIVLVVQQLERLFVLSQFA